MPDVLLREPQPPLTTKERDALRDAKEALIVNTAGEVIARSDDPLAIASAMVAIKRPLQSARAQQDSLDCEIPSEFS